MWPNFGLGLGGGEGGKERGAGEGLKRGRGGKRGYLDWRLEFFFQIQDPSMHARWQGWLQPKVNVPNGCA